MKLHEKELYIYIYSIYSIKPHFYTQWSTAYVILPYTNHILNKIWII